MSFFFFFNDTATTEIYTLSLHDALPISIGAGIILRRGFFPFVEGGAVVPKGVNSKSIRSEEHTSELQSQSNLVCRLLLEKKKTHKKKYEEIQMFRTYPHLHTQGTTTNK